MATKQDKVTGLVVDNDQVSFALCGGYYYHDLYYEMGIEGVSLAVEQDWYAASDHGAPAP